MKKVILYALLGAIVGFISSYAMASDSFLNEWSLDEFAMPITIILLAITTFFILIIPVNFMQIKKKASLALTGDAEDERDTWIYNKFGDVSLAASSAIVMALTATSIAIITNQSIVLMIVSLIILIISIPTTIAPSRLMKVVYKDRELPDPNEKDYTKKLMAVADEGERHLMLEGFYKSFQLANTLLPGGILLLMFYSEMSGDSQLFAIIILGIITIAINARYFLKIRQV